MPETVKKASKLTTLTWGKMHVDVALYKTTGGVDAAKFDTLQVEEAAEVPDTLAQLEASVTQAQAEKDDPLADDVQPAAAPVAVEEKPRPKPRKGIYREDGTFLDLTDRLEAIEEATQLEDFCVIGFVRREAVPRDRIIASYYLAGQNANALRVLRALQVGMSRVERYAVAKWTKASRQAIGVIGPAKSGALTVLELVFQANVRLPSERCLGHNAVGLTAEEGKLAVELVRSMAEPPELLRRLEDDAITMRAQLRAAAEEGLLDQWEAPTVPEPEHTTDVAAALRESVSG